MSSPHWFDVADEQTVRHLFSTRGVGTVYMKLLRRNHNSKNQIYVAPDLTELALIPTSAISANKGSSSKPGAGAPIYHASVEWVWVSPRGESRAPTAQLIYYPQYPEVRLSGLLQGSADAPRELLSIDARGQEPGRILLFGRGDGDRVFAQMLSSRAPAAARFSALSVLGEHLTAIPIDKNVGEDPAKLLLAELARVHSLGWVDSCELHTDGSIRPCRGPRCGGHTLEANLGIAMNGVPGPDFGEWEVKSHRVASLDRPASGRVTLFTPEPDQGLYSENGPGWFAEKFGRLSDGLDRYDFTGVHSVSENPNPRTGLRFVVEGYDPTTRAIESDGFIGLVASTGTVVSGWSFAKLLTHWQRKHALAAYVPALSRSGDPAQFQYGNLVHLARKTRFELLLHAMTSAKVVYDPGIKTEKQARGGWKAKARSQFRINFRDLGELYERFEQVDATSRG